MAAERGPLNLKAVSGPKRVPKISDWSLMQELQNTSGFLDASFSITCAAFAGTAIRVFATGTSKWDNNFSPCSPSRALTCTLSFCKN